MGRSRLQLRGTISARKMTRRVASLMAMLALFSIKALSQYNPIGEFKFTMPGGADISVAAGDGDINAYFAQQAIGGFIQHQAIDGLAGA